MAEERLIDEDKDRKYRIRKNAEGEEELEIIDPEAQMEKFEEAYNHFEVPEFEEDDEEAVSMTPEQLYLARKKREAAQEETAARAAALYEKACALKAEGQDEYALVTLDTAQKTCADEWRIYPMKLELISASFKDFSKLDECVQLAAELAARVPEKERAEFSRKHSKAVEAELSAARAECEQIGAKNEEGKAERRQKFKEQRKTAFIRLLYAAVPFIVFLILGIGFSTIYNADVHGLYLILTIVFFVLAAPALIACIVLARPLAKAINRLRVNESNRSTAIGRQYTECVARAEKLNKLYSAVHFSVQG